MVCEVLSPSIIPKTLYGKAVRNSVRSPPVFCAPRRQSDALSTYASEFSRRTGIPVEFVSSGGPETISPEIASALYRITQEALRNVVRHSGATPSLCLTGEKSHLTLAIRGLGLVGMEERARLIGASFQIDSAPGEGVSITLSAPLGD